ncbi:probable serine hydrolase isoform X2 [Artemia franciscana]|uniref:probable serine hydrolase isoform X2 n=1 Tax=Artemia franciscana TaxID=6661 RepID=UPI0032DBE830
MAIHQMAYLCTVYQITKEWGNPLGNPILCYHGWQDNAGTFDRLIPLLNKKFRYIALDVAGHGFSTPYPPGMLYNVWDLVVQYHRIAQYFNLDKFSMIGHSMGGGFGLVYASVFPAKVEKLVSLDMVKPVTVPLAWHTQDIGEAIEENLLAEHKMLNSKPQAVPMETLVKRYVEGTLGNLSSEGARVLLKRGAAKAPNGKGYYFTRDLRQNTASIQRFSIAEQQKLLKNIRCELLLIKSKNAPSYEPDEVYREFRDLYPKYCKSFNYLEVDGGHWVHLEHPERVAPYINEFLNSLLDF